MKIEIDQSGKIENTSKTTFLAFSNSKKSAIRIIAGEKKKLQQYFRKIGKIQLFIPLSFAAAIFLLIKNYLKEGMTIVLDIEYSGYEKFINQKLREFILENTKKENFRIYSYRIGKKSDAHKTVFRAYKKKFESQKVTAEEIMKIIEKNKKSGSI